MCSVWCARSRLCSVLFDVLFLAVAVLYDVWFLDVCVFCVCCFVGVFPMVAFVMCLFLCFACAEVLFV